MLSDLDLTEQKDQAAHTLSGGQKRKLSVAISMIGDSKVIMLDEPTSGMTRRPGGGFGRCSRKIKKTEL